MSTVKINLLVIGSPQLPALRKLETLSQVCNVSISDDAATLQRLIPMAEVILVASMAPQVSLALFWSHAKNVRWVHSLATGVEKLLFPALIDNSVPLTNARGVFKRPLAEFAVLGILFHTKHVRRLVDNQRDARWDPFPVDWANDRVLGVVGYGEIGRECARLAKGLGLKIHAMRRNLAKSSHDPLVDRAFAPAQLLDMLAGIDVLLCAAPLTAATHRMIGAAAFNAMKSTAVVINVGRGPVIDESALIQALRNGRIAGASLDVFEHEPLPASSPLWGMKNVLISPHCTDQTRDPDWLDLSMQMFLDNFARYRAGEVLENLVDKQAGY